MNHETHIYNKTEIRPYDSFVQIVLPYTYDHCFRNLNTMLKYLIEIKPEIKDM